MDREMKNGSGAFNNTASTTIIGIGSADVSPLPGLDFRAAEFPRLTPWATMFRRSRGEG